MSSKMAISSAQETSQSKLSDMTALRELTEVVEHELQQLGLIRAYTDEYYDAMTREEIMKRLTQLEESAKVSEAAELNDTKEYLKGIERTRHPVSYTHLTLPTKLEV